nr:MAG TPA: baseplate protein [Caudoviricetes sp.]
MQQSNASLYNINQLGGGAEFQQNVISILSRLNFGEIVEVVEVESGGVGPVGFVSVKPLLMRITADNENIEQATIHNVPYFRLQGGKNAVITDPQKGDIGFCSFASRDISLVKRNRAKASMNVFRIAQESDAFFFGGWSKETPDQYIWFDGDNVKIKAKAKIILDAPEVEATGNFTASGIIKSLTDVIAKTINLFTHKHGGVQRGSSDTDEPK